MLVQFLARTVASVRQPLFEGNVRFALEVMADRLKALLEGLAAENADQRGAAENWVLNWLAFLKELNSVTELTGRGRFVPHNCLLAKPSVALRVAFEMPECPL